MSTRAIVVDDRVDGKAFYIYTDGELDYLGVELVNCFNNSLPLETMMMQVIQGRIDREYELLQKCSATAGIEYKTIARVMKARITPISPEYTQIAKTGSLDNVRKYVDSGIEYLYIFKQDGVYVKGVGGARFSKVKGGKLKYA